MRRIFSQFLIISVLFSGVAWAANIHAIAVFDHSDGQEQELQTASQDEVIDIELCDHCCHGATHIVGILCSSSNTYTDPNGALELTHLSTLYSLTHTPPTPPPTA